MSRTLSTARRRRQHTLGVWGAIVCVLGMVAGVRPAFAQGQPGMPGTMGMAGGIVASNVPKQFESVGFRQQLGKQLPLDAMFRDETGKDVRLGDYFGKRPVLLSFVYFQCPMLCSQVMNGLSSALRTINFGVGQEFDVVLISFDPRDTPEAANAKKRAHLEKWQTNDTAGGWHFLTGDRAAIEQVTKAAGFSYTWDDATQQFAHVSGVLATTADGRLSRYFYGVEFSPRELRLALVDSGEGKIGSAVEQLLLYCYEYDPTSGRYGLVVMNIVRLGAIATVALLAAYFLLMRRRDSRATVERHA